MFGYVLPPLDTLPEGEKERFRRVYCGLCHTLGRRYGPAARMMLNYDFTFLAILLSEPHEPEAERRRCAVSPIRCRACLPASPALELAADQSVILAYWQLRDGAADDRLLRGFKYRAGAGVLRSAYKKAAAARPSFSRNTQRQLELLSALEKERCSSMDQAADAFASLLAGAASEMRDPVGRRVLEQLLYHLGRWVYLIDAADDLKEDAASGNYNPVALRFGLTDGQWTPEARRQFAATLDHSIHQMTTAFELWDFGVWTPLLESTLYTGLFQVGHAVLDGTFRRRRRNRKNEKNEEAT